MKVIVTGLPRSGTSFLAGLIAKMGYRTGPESWLKPADANNRFGYYECVPLIHISERILAKLNGDFHRNIPILKDGWTNAFEAEKQEILHTVQKGRIELYKGNRLVVLADLYDDLFPDARWIYIQRDIVNTFQSRFGDAISFSDWEVITQKRIDAWHRTGPSKKALNIHYEDFQKNMKSTLDKIVSHLDIMLTKQQYQTCMSFYRPRNRKLHVTG